MKSLLLTAILTFIILLSFPLAQEDAQLVDLSRTQFAERNYNVVKNLKEEKCLTEAIYYEAGNQGEPPPSKSQQQRSTRTPYVPK